MPFANRRRVGYYYDDSVGNFYYAQGHPMKPHRMRMTHNLLLAYNMFDKMDILTSPRASDREMTRFHSDEYINFLKVVTPDTIAEHSSNLSRFNILDDCPVFDGLWEYCQIAAGGSLAGAARLNAGESDTVINWAGGLHHAKRSEASGFCYINDCVLAILELLKVHSRVLYVDIDIHHGDGVEEAFYTTDRVMTASFHKYGDYFPGTGDVSDDGIGRGKNYCVNFPLKDGIDDESYRETFEPVMKKVMEMYSPGAVVLQCGADSLSGDRLGCFNLSLKGHAQCVDFFDNYNVPLLLLGGGGYTIRNVARCWAYETSRVINADIADELPYNDNYEFYGPEFRLHIATSNMENHNTREYLDKTKSKILEQLRHLPHVPSVPIMDVPRSSPLGVHNRDYDSDNDDPDVRKKTDRAKRVPEYIESDEENEDDEYMSGLRLSNRRIKRSTFPRRSPLKANERTTSTNSPAILAAAHQAYISSPGGTTAPNGSVKRPGLLVNTTESGGTAATSDEPVKADIPHAPDDSVDSSRLAKRKEGADTKSEPASVAKRQRSAERPESKAGDVANETSTKKNDTSEPMEVDKPDEAKEGDDKKRESGKETPPVRATSSSPSIAKEGEKEEKTEGKKGEKPDETKPMDDKATWVEKEKSDVAEEASEAQPMEVSVLEEKEKTGEAKAAPSTPDGNARGASSSPPRKARERGTSPVEKKKEVGDSKEEGSSKATEDKKGSESPSETPKDETAKEDGVREKKREENGDVCKTSGKKGEERKKVDDEATKKEEEKVSEAEKSEK